MPAHTHPTVGMCGIAVAHFHSSLGTGPRASCPALASCTSGTPAGVGCWAAHMCSSPAAAWASRHAVCLEGGRPVQPDFMKSSGAGSKWP